MGSVRTGPAPRANTVGGISMRFRTQLAVAAIVVSALAVGSLLGGVLGDGGRLGGCDRRPRRRLVRRGSGAHRDRRRRRNRHARARARGSRAPRRRTVARAPRLRLPAALARDRGRLQPAALGSGAPARVEARSDGLARGDRARVARAHQTRLSLGARDRTARRAPRPVQRADIRPRRGCPARARPVRGRLPRVRAHDRAPSERRLVRAHRVRPRAPRRPGRRASGDAACGRRGVRSA